MDDNNKIKAQATKEGNELMRKLPKDLSNIIQGVPYLFAANFYLGFVR